MSDFVIHKDNFPLFNHAITMSRFSFPATFTPDESDGGFVVTFQDLPEAITQGDSMEQALAEAADCLEEAMLDTSRYAIAIGSISLLIPRKHFH
ncbi:MAG: type II toxin-antitoxin system HicB family antitoxin [Moorea sp. SIO3G5]|nr:type II toxin-antitoxin system HicB family antitoxin [Moorena sp. SIO3G5]